MRKKIAFKHPIITLGSPYGIGYEIFLLALNRKIFKNICPVCIGSEKVIKLFQKMLNINKKFKSISENKINSLGSINTTKINFILINIDNSNTKIDNVKLIPSKLDGLYAYKSIDIASQIVNKDKFESIVTLPVSKKNINLIEPSFLGHTEFFKNKWNEKNVFMTFISKKINVLLLTTHIPLNKVSDKLNPQVIKKGLEAASQLKKRLRLMKKICFLGLNPHASENGLLGKEDLWIKEVIDKYNIKNNTNIYGPVPSDTAFTKPNRKKYGLYIACYHDQGLIPFKIFSFKNGVNLSFGMKHIRTSVDHGTAVDLIGKKKADLRSFINAYKLAVKLAKK